MNANLELKNSNGRNIQINCVREFTFDNYTYSVIAGEDGSIKVNEEYLPYATDNNGWLVQIEDIYIFETDLIYQDKKIIQKNILIVSSDGVIALYTEVKNNKWDYKILVQDSDCYYEIKEATCVDSLLSLRINTEFNNLKEYNFEIIN